MKGLLGELGYNGWYFLGPHTGLNMSLNPNIVNTDFLDVRETESTIHSCKVVKNKCAVFLELMVS